MVGDASDNIKGADKVGPKTAAYLLNRFGTLDNILANAESIEKPSIRDSIIRNADRLRTNYKIIRLNNATQLPFALNNLAYSFAEVVTTDVLKGIGIY
jgi:DNA polymerase-1